MRRIVILCALLCAACSAQSATPPANVSVGHSARLASPPVAAAGDAPRIVAMEFSTLDVERPGTWSGRIITTTNVASVEMRTNQFAVSVPRAAFGDFRFDLHVLDVPPDFVRHYQLRVIARNTAGVEAEEDVPFRIR